MKQRIMPFMQKQADARVVTGIPEQCLDQMADKKNKTRNKDIRSIQDEYGFERKEIRIQRVFWVFVVVFLTAGLLGVFGNGILSHKRVEGDKFFIEYDRYMKQETPVDMSIYLKTPQNRTMVSINKEYIAHIIIQGVVPQPQSVVAKGNQLVYTFKASRGGLITFYLKPVDAGAKTLELTVQGEKKRLKQYVYF